MASISFSKIGFPQCSTPGILSHDSDAIFDAILAREQASCKAYQSIPWQDKNRIEQLGMAPAQTSMNNKH
jgi:hypothetical protein